jgi:hypothetical protein
MDALRVVYYAVDVMGARMRPRMPRNARRAQDLLIRSAIFNFNMDIGQRLRIFVAADSSIGLLMMDLGSALVGRCRLANLLAQATAPCRRDVATTTR